MSAKVSPRARASHGGSRKERTSSPAVPQSAAAPVIRPVPGEWHPRIPERLDEEELADWRAGRNAVYQLAALTIGARLTVADA